MISLSKRRQLQLMVVMNMVVTIIKMTAKTTMIKSFGGSSLLVFSASILKIIPSYTEKYQFSLPSSEILGIAFFCTLSNFIGYSAFNDKQATAVSYTIYFYIHTALFPIFVFLINGQGLDLFQYVGILLLTCGITMDIVKYNNYKAVPTHVILSLVSGFLLNLSSIIFEICIRPILPQLDNYMMDFSVASVIFSLLLFILDCFYGDTEYRKIFENFHIYLILGLELLASHLLNFLSTRLNPTERTTLINFNNFFGSIITDLILNESIMALRTIPGFAFTGVGAQMFNYFRK